MMINDNCLDEQTQEITRKPVRHAREVSWTLRGLYIMNKGKCLIVNRSGRRYTQIHFVVLK